MPKGMSTNLLISILAALAVFSAAFIQAEHALSYHPERSAVERKAMHGYENRGK
jgi:hypothetical protein